MDEQQIWELITGEGYMDGNGLLDQDKTWAELSRSYAATLAVIADKLSVTEIVELINFGMAVHHKGSAET